MIKADRDRLAKLHTMRCIACGASPVEAHHMINQQHKTRDHQRTIPLCGDRTKSWGCHTGPFSIHGSRKSWREKYGHEEDLLLKTNELLGRMT